MDEELQAFLEADFQEKMRRGLSQEEALREARAEMGSTDAVKQKVWAAGWESFFENLWNDVRYGIRHLRKSPGFTAVVIIILALGIGANTAIFSLINAIMLRMLPVNDPQSLVILRWKARGPVHRDAHPELVLWDGCPGERSEACSFSYPLFQQVEAQTRIFAGAFAFIEQPGMTVNESGRISLASGLQVSGGFFPTLGVQPALGRLLDPQDDASGAIPPVVISYRLWQNVLGGDRAVIGKSLLVGKSQYTIVGVAQPHPLQLDPGLSTDFWVPISAQSYFQTFKSATDVLAFQVIARLKPGVDVGQATTVASTIFAVGTTTGPAPLFSLSDSPQVELPTVAYGESSLRHQFSKPLYALLAAVAVVLLITCANIAGLMLARTSRRLREVAVRSALGAKPGRIIRQLLAESLLLAGAGGVAGVLLGSWGSQALAAFLMRNRTWFIPLEVNVHPDVRVLAVTAVVSTTVGLAFGLVPALSCRKVDLVPALKEGAASWLGVSPSQRSTVGKTLVVVQIALAMLMLVGAGLLVRTLRNLETVDTGFEPEHLLIFGVNTTYSNRTGSNVRLLHREIRDQLATLPGVISASYSAFPLLAGMDSSRQIYAEGQAAAPIDASSFWIGPDFFKTMRIPLLEGRVFNPHEMEEPPPSPSPGNPNGIQGGSHPVVINRALAQVLFGNQPAVGRMFTMGGLNGPSSDKREIVGVVGDTKLDSLRDTKPPLLYGPAGDLALAFEVRTANPRALIPEIRAAISRFDSNLLITDMKTQEEQIDQNIYQERLIADLSGLFALLALLVACVGIYGLLSYRVAQRTQEIGVRLALGAEQSDILRLVVEQGAILVAIGVTIGITAALGVTRFLQSFLFEVKPSDPLTLICVVLLLAIVALVACFIPARRASKVDPVVALRYE